MTGEPRGFSRVTAGFSSYDGEFRMPLVFPFIIFLASNEISRALRVFQKLAEGLWKPYPDPARLALFEREPAPS